MITCRFRIGSEQGDRLVCVVLFNKVNVRYFFGLLGYVKPGCMILWDLACLVEYFFWLAHINYNRYILKGPRDYF